MQIEVDVVEIEAIGYTNTRRVTLQRGDDYVSCAGVRDYVEESEEVLGHLFDEWCGYAAAGDVNYTHWRE